MNDIERLFERERQTRLHLRRLRVNSTICWKCGEQTPSCFLGEFNDGDRRRGVLVALCERCRRKSQPHDRSVEQAWADIRAKGATNGRCLCGEDNPFCMEVDHVAGQKWGPTVFALCINCHLKRTSRQLTEHGGDPRPTSQAASMLKLLQGLIHYREIEIGHLRIVEEFLKSLAMGASTA